MGAMKDKARNSEDQNDCSNCQSPLGLCYGKKLGWMVFVKHLSSSSEAPLSRRASVARRLRRCFLTTMRAKLQGEDRNESLLHGTHATNGLWREVHALQQVRKARVRPKPRKAIIYLEDQS